MKGRCKHFNGVQHETCKAGVKYADVRRERVPQVGGYSIPCLEKYNHTGATCDKCEMPTPEEVAAKEREFEKRMAETMAARAAIVAHLGPWKRGRAGQGCITCPVCGIEKALSFSRAGINGHIHAACKTDDCVCWME